MGTTNTKRRGRLWWTAFIIGLIYAVLLTFLMIGVGGDVAWELQLPELLPLLVAALILGSVALAWKWELISGILLIIEGLFLIIVFTIFQLWDYVWLFLPFPVVGVLFLLSWFLSWREWRRHL